MPLQKHEQIPTPDQANFLLFSMHPAKDLHYFIDDFPVKTKIQTGKPSFWQFTPEDQKKLQAKGAGIATGGTVVVEQIDRACYKS